MSDIGGYPESAPERDPLRVTGCECRSPGWCERHRCHKGRDYYEQCRRSQELFDAWEAGRGPGQLKVEGTPVVLRPPCRHLGAELDAVECASCAGRVRIKVFACAQWGRCSIQRRLPDQACCAECPDHVPKEPAPVDCDR
ncbi:MAG: hypothetical protein KF847_20720 [Pirellulales bacterium]|nr:hypothetical protein [Pirellulales bacterium]